MLGVPSDERSAHAFQPRRGCRSASSAQSTKARSRRFFALCSLELASLVALLPVRESEHPQEELDRALDGYAAGVDAAFAVVHRLLARRLRNFLLHLSGSRALADDLMQETFFRIHRARGSFKAGSPALPWALAIARNVYIDHARKHRHEAKATQESLAEHISPAPSPERDVELQRALELVRRTLLELPLAQREAFVLLRFEQLSTAEAASVLGVSEAAVKLRAFRAAEVIRAALRESEQR
jgi:RNA polymerase sigma-70 factor (ECF subfamily)